MNLGSLLLAIWLILVGVTWAGWVAIDGKVLGLVAILTGVVWLIEAYHPIVIGNRR